MGQGKIRGWIVSTSEPTPVRGKSSLCHEGMIALPRSRHEKARHSGGPWKLQFTFSSALPVDQMLLLERRCVIITSFRTLLWPGIEAN